MAKKIGKILHFFDKISVAAMILAAPLRVGDMVKILGHGKEFTQTISSMQIEHKAIEKAKKGDDVAFKVDQPVVKGDVVEAV